MDLRDWKQLFAPQILRRGKAYHQERAVERLQWEGDVVKASVLGSERYRIEIGLKNGYITDWSCSCPYASEGNPCKHLAAVFFELDADRGKALAPAMKQTPIQDVIQGLDLEKARALLLWLAEQNEETADQIRLVAEPPSRQQLQRWEKRIDRMLNRAAGRYEYINYDQAWDTMCELADFVSDIADRLLASGSIWEAFSLTGYGFQAAFQVDMDDSDGGLTMLAETCHELWSAQYDVADLELRRRMYQWFQDACKYSNNLCREFLWEEQEKLFRNPEFLRANMVQLDRMIGEEQAREGQGYSRLPQLVLQKLELMEELGAPREKLQQWERKHWDIPEVRHRAIYHLMESKQYGEAEALLQESKELDREWPGLVRRCSQELIGLYEETGQTEKLLEELQFQVFQCGQNDLTYVKKLREQISPEQWPELRERLLAGNTLYGDLAEEILELDGLYGRLMDRVTALESLSTLTRWERVLRARFPERMRDAYVQCLHTQMRRASNRKQYAAVISYLRKLQAYPGDKDTELAQQWRMTYPRRSNMLDELSKAGY